MTYVGPFALVGVSHQQARAGDAFRSAEVFSTEPLRNWNNYSLDITNYFTYIYNIIAFLKAMKFFEILLITYV